MKYLKIPHTEQRLEDGSVVMLKRFPNTKWIVHNRWYTYLGQEYNGWYFSSIPSQTIIPMNAQDLHSLTIVSNFASGPTHCDQLSPGQQLPIIESRPLWPQPDQFPGVLIPPHVESDHHHGHDHHDHHGHHEHHEGFGTHCAPGGFPPLPPKPHRGHSHVRSPERYLGGVNYLQGQLVYMQYGDIYQATVDFRSSWKAPSVVGNFKKDINSGYIVPVAPALGKEISDALAELDKEVKEITERVDGLEAAVEHNKVRKYLVNFHYVFGTDEPTKEHADRYLAEFDTPIEPSVGIFFKNLDKNAPTWRHVFTYYITPGTTSKLMFVDDTVDTITTGPVIEDFTIAEHPSGGYKTTKTIRVLETGETTVIEDDYPFANLTDIRRIVNQLDTKVDKTVAGDDGFILRNATLEIRDTRGPHTFLSLVKEYISLDDGTIRTQKDEIKPVDWGIPSVEQLEAIDAKFTAALENTISKDITKDPIVQSTKIVGTDDGIKLVSTLLSLADGSIETAEEMVTLLSMGAVSRVELDGMVGDVGGLLAMLDDLRVKGVQVQHV